MSTASGNLTISLTEMDKSELVEMLFERLQPFINQPKEVITDDLGQHYLTRAEAQHYLKISSSSLTGLQKEGHLKFLKMKRKVIFKKTDLDEYVEKNTINQQL